MKRNPFHSSMLWLTVAALGAFALLPQQPTSAQSAAPADLAQGKYLVENVGFCIGCHGASLQGQALPATAAPNAVPYPSIAGLPQFAKDEDAVKFFETGLLPDGSKARRPMRQFRFKHSDALALVAYLRSVPKAP